MFNMRLWNKKKPVKPLNITNGTKVREFEFDNIKWIDIIKPTGKEIEMLKQKFNFHELLLEDCMTEHQRPKIDDFGEYSFIVIHLPRYRKNLLRIDTEEIDIFISKEHLVTLHEGELKPIVDIANKCEIDTDLRKEYMENGSALLLYEIIKELFNYCFPMLDKIGISLDYISKEVFDNRSKHMLETIARIKMQIITYRAVIKPLRPVIITLERVIAKYLPENNDDKYFDDITDKIEAIWNMLENYKEVIESEDDTFESLTSHTINNLMRIFTIVQVIILPMTLVGGLFSMNVSGIPMHSYPGAFWIVFGMILIPTGLIMFLLMIKKNKWL